LQVDTRWKALAEIYTLHSFAPFSNLILFSFKIAECFADFLHNFAKFTRILLNFVKFRPIFSGFSQKLNAAIFTFSIFQRCKFESSRYGVSSTIQLISKFKFDPHPFLQLS